MSHISYPSLLLAWTDVELYTEKASDSRLMAVITVLALEHPLVHFIKYQSVIQFQKPQASLFDVTSQQGKTMV